MKRLLSVLVIAIVALSGVYAEWAFSGNFDVGYTFGFDGTKNVTTVSGDNSAPEAGFLYLKGGNDYLSLDVRTDIQAGQTIIRDGGVGMTGTLNMTNLINDAFQTDIPVAVSLYLGNQSPETDADWAYSDPHGIDDEISLGASRAQYPFGVSVGYDDLVTAYAYGALDIDNVTSGNAGALFELRVQPIDGVRANIGYVASALETAQDFQVSALVDISTLLGLDFSLDVSASYLANIDNAADNSHFMAAVTGGFAGLGAYVEYEYYNDLESASVIDNQHNLYIGASYDLDQLVVPLSFGAELVLGDMVEDFTTGASVSVDAALMDVHFYGELGVEDFGDGDTGYVTIGTYMYF